MGSGLAQVYLLRAFHPGLRGGGQQLIRRDVSGSLAAAPRAFAPLLIDNLTIAGLFYATGLTQETPQGLDTLRLSLLRGNHIDLNRKTHNWDTVSL
jgi:hypothetical protein